MEAINWDTCHVMMKEWEVTRTWRSVRDCINDCVVLINPHSMNIALINPHSMNSAPLFHNIELFIWKTSLLKQTLNTPTISTSGYGISKSNNSRFFLSIFVPKIELFFFYYRVVSDYALVHYGNSENNFIFLKKDMIYQEIVDVWLLAGKFFSPKISKESQKYK